MEARRGAKMAAGRSGRRAGRADSGVKAEGFDEAPGFSAQRGAIIWRCGVEGGGSGV